MIPNILAICVSKEREVWPLDEIPFYCHTEGWRPFGRERTRDRIQYLAARRNSAVSEGLRRFADVQHILMIDSYYIRQPQQVLRLVEAYNGKEILGASTWFNDLTRVRARVRFWDSWTTPEAFDLTYSPSLNGRIRVRAVGSCYAYPTEAWRKTSYGVPEDLHGCEHNVLCEGSNLSVYLSLDVKLWRDPVKYSWMKRFRHTLNLGRLFHN